MNIIYQVWPYRKIKRIKYLIKLVIQRVYISVIVVRMLINRPAHTNVNDAVVDKYSMLRSCYLINILSTPGRSIHLIRGSSQIYKLNLARGNLFRCNSYLTLMLLGNH
jgi:hypothetical protein